MMKSSLTRRSFCGASLALATASHAEVSDLGNANKAMPSNHGSPAAKPHRMYL